MSDLVCEELGPRLLSSNVTIANNLSLTTTPKTNFNQLPSTDKNDTKTRSQDLGVQTYDTQVCTSMLEQVVVGGSASPREPVLIILGAGVDAAHDVVSLAEKLGVGDNNFQSSPQIDSDSDSASVVTVNRVKVLSMGQGQGKRAAIAVTEAMRTGTWVLLQNCHLSASFMPELARIVDEIGDEGIELPKSFRLLLTVELPCFIMPESVIQRCNKIAMERPRGVRNSVLEAIDELPESLTGMGKPVSGDDDVFLRRRLCFMCSFLHGTLMQRRRYESLGWKEMYDFGRSDLEVTLLAVNISVGDSSLEEAFTTKRFWNATRHLIGNVIYGGRIVDEQDQKTLVSIVNKLITPNVEVRHNGTDLFSRMMSMKRLSRKEVISTANSLPPDHEETPELFGLLPSASKMASKFEVQMLFSILHESTTTSIGDDSSYNSNNSKHSDIEFHSDKACIPFARMALEKVNEVLIELPKAINIQYETSHKYSNTRRMSSGRSGVPSAASTPSRVTSTPAPSTIVASSPELEPVRKVLSMEVTYFNAMLRHVRLSVTRLLASTTENLWDDDDVESIEILKKLAENQVPKSWSNNSNNMTLSGWLIFIQRCCDELCKWAASTNAMLPCFWLPALRYPRALMVAVMQRHSRQHCLHLESLEISVNFNTDLGIIKTNPRSTQPSMVTPATNASMFTPATPSKAAQRAAVARDGIVVTGLNIQQARWDTTNNCIIEAIPGVNDTLFNSPMPPLHIIPSLSKHTTSASSIKFIAPLYSNSIQNTNVNKAKGSKKRKTSVPYWVIDIPLPIDVKSKSDDWRIRGTALYIDPLI